MVCVSSFVVCVFILIKRPVQVVCLWFCFLLIDVYGNLLFDLETRPRVHTSTQEYILRDDPTRCYVGSQKPVGHLWLTSDIWASKKCFYLRLLLLRRKKLAVLHHPSDVTVIVILYIYIYIRLSRYCTGYTPNNSSTHWSVLSRNSGTDGFDIRHSIPNWDRITMHTRRCSKYKWMINVM